MTALELIRQFDENQQVDAWKTVDLLYSSAVNEIETKMKILNSEFQYTNRYNPIEHIKTRVKSPEGIVGKLKRYGKETTIENAVEFIKDIAGLRIICSFTSDIYRLAEIIGNQDDITILTIKDYIKEPKESGYKSLHMIVTIPIFLSGGVVDTPVEIQIRTIAMDFWASLEHKLNYKLKGDAPEYIKKDLRSTAEMISKLDEKMMELNKSIVTLLNESALDSKE